MAPTLESLGIDRLPREERMELAFAIWDSVAAEPGAPRLSAARRLELERRAAEDDESPELAIPWEQVEAEIRSELRSKR